MNSFFLSVEGTDGSGKSTQLKKIATYLREKGQTVLMTREPGGTEISEQIRGILLDPKNQDMGDKTEVLLYAAARSQHIEEFILPALSRGETVLTDRFTDSSVAYQGFGRGLGTIVTQVNEIATGGFKPHLTIFLDLPPDVGIQRKKQEVGHTMDRMELEKQTFHQRVYEGYIHLCETEKSRIRRINANRSIEDVFSEIQIYLDELFGF